MWDFNKEINITLEDALFSAKSMAIMFGNGKVKGIKTDASASKKLIMKSEQFTATAAVASGLTSETAKTAGWNEKYEAPDGKLYAKISPVFFDAEGKKTEALVKGDKYFCTYDLEVSGSVIEVSGNSFPGVYYAVGDTMVRSAESGLDEAFQLIIPKAKVLSENTITMEAKLRPLAS